MMRKATTTTEAARMLNTMAAQIRGAKKGTRNSTLNVAAFALGMEVGAGNLQRKDVEERLSEAATACGLENSEIRATTASGLDAGIARWQAGDAPSARGGGERTRQAQAERPWPTREAQLLKVWLTTWDHRLKPGEGVLHQFTLEQLAEHFHTPPVKASSRDDMKEDLPLWACARYENNYRAGKHLIELSALMLDLDGASGVTEEGMRAVLGPLCFMAYTTFSHTRELPRWRLVVPFARPVTPREYQRIWTAALAKFPGVDKSTSDPGRGYYVPLDRPGSQYEKMVQLNPSVLDPDRLLEQLDKPEAKKPEAEVMLLRDLSEGDWLRKPPSARQALLTCSDRLGIERTFLLRGKTAMIAAPGGSHKTSAMIQLALSTACGTPWLGRFRVESPGEVMIVLGEEDVFEIVRRMQTAARHLDLSDEQCELAYQRIHVVPAYGRDVRLDHPNGEETAFFQQLQAHLSAEKRRAWALLILDPAARMMNAAAEIDAAAATRFIESLEQLTQSPGNPCVVVTHHTSKQSLRSSEKDQGAPRGSSALTDGARWMAHLGRPLWSPEARQALATRMDVESNRIVRLEILKSNYTCLPERGFLFKSSSGGILVPLSAQEEQAVEEVESMPPAGASSRRRADKKERDKGSKELPDFLKEYA